jgi:hypothetical protein
MFMKTYHDREWLTEVGNPSTPTIVSFAGEVVWELGGDPEEHYKIEIASCSGKVNLHKTPNQSSEDWQRQVEKLHDHIGRYLDFLRT